MEHKYTIKHVGKKEVASVMEQKIFELEGLKKELDDYKTEIRQMEVKLAKVLHKQMQLELKLSRIDLDCLFHESLYRC